MATWIGGRKLSVAAQVQIDQMLSDPGRKADIKLSQVVWRVQLGELPELGAPIAVNLAVFISVSRMEADAATVGLCSHEAGGRLLEWLAVVRRIDANAYAAVLQLALDERGDIITAAYTPSRSLESILTSGSRPREWQLQLP